MPRALSAAARHSAVCDRFKSSLSEVPLYPSTAELLRLGILKQRLILRPLRDLMHVSGLSNQSLPLAAAAAAQSMAAKFLESAHCRTERFD